jgi:hypothetical protein
MAREFLRLRSLIIGFLSATIFCSIIYISTAFGAELENAKEPYDDSVLSLKVKVIEYQVRGYRLFRRARAPYIADLLVGKVIDEGKFKDRVFHFLVPESHRPYEPTLLLEAKVSIYTSVLERKVFIGEGYNETYPVKTVAGVIWQQINSEMQKEE